MLAHSLFRGLAARLGAVPVEQKNQNVELVVELAPLVAEGEALSRLDDLPLCPARNMPQLPFSVVSRDLGRSTAIMAVASRRSGRSRRWSLWSPSGIPRSTGGGSTT